MVIKNCSRVLKLSYVSSLVTIFKKHENFRYKSYRTQKNMLKFFIVLVYSLA